jgi:hypothetical protein
MKYEEMRSGYTYKASVSIARDHLGDLMVDGRIILIMV